MNFRLSTGRTLYGVFHKQIEFIIRSSPLFSQKLVLELCKVTKIAAGSTVLVSV